MTQKKETFQSGHSREKKKCEKKQLWSNQFGGQCTKSMEDRMESGTVFIHL